MKDDGEDLERLRAFVGEWTVQIDVADVPPGKVSFEWELDGRFLIQRVEIPQPEFPNSLAIIAPDASGGGYTQHYFDSRGVVRTYAMGFEEGRWTLLRDRPDFTELAFFQRYAGAFTDDSMTIEGTWETSDDGLSWERDFDLTYTRVA
jgi:hypothetical protein